MVSSNISIILPTYNRVDSLKDCIRSIFNQTYYDWELIIVDDSPTNVVKYFIEELLINDSRIRYYKNKNRLGLPGSRNIGIGLSNFELILFIEDDLILEPDVLNILMNDYNELKSNASIGAIASSRPWILLEDYLKKEDRLNLVVSSKMNFPSIRDKFTGIIFSDFSPRFGAIVEVPDVHSCSLYPKKVLTEVGGYDEKTFKGNFLYEESDLNYRIWKRGYRFYFDPKAIMYHIMTSSGGCRVSSINYKYYFVLNHIKYTLKNFRYRSIYMIPLFLIYILLKSISNILSKKAESI